MNCTNCGAVVDIKNKECDFCGTTFTDKEMGIEPNVPSKKETEVKVKEPQRPKTLTEQKIEELRKEQKNRLVNSNTSTSANNILNEVAIRRAFNFFPRVRSFFRDLKRTVSMILLVVLEAIFAFVLISGKITQLIEGEMECLIAINVVILINALLAGIINRIGYLRAGTAIVAVFNFLAVIWSVFYPLIKTDFANQTPQSVAILALVEVVVLIVSVWLCNLVYRKM